MIYTVHARAEPLSSLKALDETRFVKDGFSWPAFFFSWLWLAAKRMWIVLALFVALQLLAAAFAAAIAAPFWFTWAFGFGVSLFLGLEGNALYRWSLARRGYREVALEAGSSPAEAEDRYFER
jgi:hypothetical protein